MNKSDMIMPCASFKEEMLLPPPCCEDAEFDPGLLLAIGLDTPPVGEAVCCGPEPDADPEAADEGCEAVVRNGLELLPPVPWVKSSLNDTSLSCCEIEALVSVVSSALPVFQAAIQLLEVEVNDMDPPFHELQLSHRTFATNAPLLTPESSSKVSWILESCRGIT